MTIYIVGGSCGEYDYSHSWDIKAFSTLEKANELVKQLEDWLEKNNLTDGNYYDTIPECPFDNQFRYDSSTGTH